MLVLYIFAAERVPTILTGHLSGTEPRNQKKKWEEERKNKREERRHGRDGKNERWGCRSRYTRTPGCEKQKEGTRENRDIRSERRTLDVQYCKVKHARM